LSCAAPNANPTRSPVRSLKTPPASSSIARPRKFDTTMPELLIDFITSLDGYAAADGWPGWWGLEGPEYLAWLGQQPEADYTVLMGANTYHLSHVWKRRDRT